MISDTVRGWDWPQLYESLDRHGYAIIQDVEERTEGELRMSAGTLYRSVARMVDQGLSWVPRPSRSSGSWRSACLSPTTPS